MSFTVRTSLSFDFVHFHIVIFLALALALTLAFTPVINLYIREFS